eukprot:m.45784 g.45784  ORF g.45784 m.45784 type:complete len:778 (+) comp33634_c0_seq6:121-2454(+)
MQSTRKRASPAADKPPPGPNNHKRLIFLLSCLFYLNTIGGELVFDDHEAIVTNEDVRPSKPIQYIFQHDFWGVPLLSNDSHKSYRPLTTLTFRWNFALHGLHPYGYHLVNVLLHAAVSTLVFSTCEILFEGSMSQGSFAAALLFAVHPVHTEAVAGVVGRAELLAAFFYLLAFQAYTRGLQKGRSSISYGWLFATALSAGCATLSKESGITVLASCAVYDILYVCNLDGWGMLSIVFIDPCPKWVKALVKRLVFLFATLSFFLTLRIYFLAGGVATSFVESDNPTLFDPDWATRLRTYAYLCAFNAWLLLCPHNLCYDWSMDSIPRVKTYGDIRNLATLATGLALLVLIISSLFWKRSSKPGCSSVACQSNGIAIASNGRVSVSETFDESGAKAERVRQRVLAMGLCLTIAPFIPASNLFFPVGFVVAERVLYLPSIGFCLLVALGLSSFGKASRHHDGVSNWWPSMRLSRGTSSLFYILLLLFSLKTVQRNSEWLDTQSLAKAGIRVNPGNAKVHLTLGNVLAQKGLRICEKSYREAIQLRPHYAAAWTNLGLVLLNTERPQEAEEAYATALRHKPNSADASTNYGHLCRIQERWKEADKLYRIALKRRPHDPVLNYNLGLANEKMAQLKVAENHYEHVLLVEPHHTDAAFHLASLLSTTNFNHVRLKADALATGKRAKKAENVYRSALRFRADFYDGWMQLGKLLLYNDNVDGAEIVFRQAIALNSKDSSGYFHLGKTMERKGVAAEAVEAYKKAAELDPSHELVKNSLKRFSRR